MPRKPPYTPEEVAALRRLYPTATPAEIMAALPGHSWQTLARKANALGIMRPHRMPSEWSAAENALLQQHYASVPQAELLRLLAPRSLTGIRHHANRMGLVRTAYRGFVWATEKLDVLRAVYPVKGPAGAQLVLPEFSLIAIRVQAHKLGLSAPPRPRKPAKKRVRKPRPKPAKLVVAKPPREAPAPKPLPTPGVSLSARTPNLNANKAARLAQQRQAKPPAVTAADVQRLDYNHPARQAYNRAARHGGPAAQAAFQEAMSQLAA